MMITAFPSSEDFSRSKNPDLLASSRDDVTIDQKGLTADEHINSREKRFFINKNQFVVSTVVTTFAFVNTTVTRTVNLLNPAPAAPCAPTDSTNPCACLPAGFVVCPPAGR